MSEALIIVMITLLLVLGSILLSVGATEFLDPWSTKEKVFGGIKLMVGVLLLIANIVFMALVAEGQAAFEMRCLSKGGFPQSRVCYKDGKEIVVDEEG